jgi:tetratricopeptide (TPR) repeat protein
MRNIIFAIVAALIIAGGGWYYAQMSPSFTLEIDSRDTITNWDFQGSHKDGGEFEARVTKEMEKLQAALEDDATEPTDYSIYVSMAGQYTLLGDGKSTLKYLEKALAIDSVKTGLAWHNVGVLMERLGAIHTARTAYARAVEAQSQIDAYHIARFSFLIKHFSEDKEAVDAALNEAAVEFGEDDLFVMNARAEWFEMQEEWQEAIGAWEKILAGAPEEIKAGIREKIRKLRDGIQKSKDDEAAHEGQ